MPRLPPLSKFTDPPRELRDGVVRVRVSRAESAMFADLADHYELSRSELIRALVRREAARLGQEGSDG